MRGSASVKVSALRSQQANRFDLPHCHQQSGRAKGGGRAEVGIGASYLEHRVQPKTNGHTKCTHNQLDGDSIDMVSAGQSQSECLMMSMKKYNHTLKGGGEIAEQ